MNTKIASAWNALPEQLRNGPELRGLFEALAAAPARLLQDETQTRDSKGLSQWLASRPDARLRAREVAAQIAAAPAQAEPEPGFIERTNADYAAWCATHYVTHVAAARGMASFHGLWAWQEQERRKTLATQPAPEAQAEPEKFDTWMGNPYTKVLMKSLEEDYVPRGAAPQPAQAEPVLTHQVLADAMKAAFEEGFGSVATYNDTVLNDVDAQWQKSQARDDAAALAALAALAAPQPAPEAERGDHADQA